MAKILLVEDDKDLALIVSDSLMGQNHLVEMVHTGPEGQEQLRFYQFDLIVLDWDLPKLSGIEICKEFRSRGGKTPVLMLTGKGAINDKEQGLDAGADDYLTKPFDIKELAARVRALLRRPIGYAPSTLKAGTIELDPSVFKVMRDGQEVRLLPKEFALLEFLMRHKGQVFNTEAILNRVWASESDASPEAFRTCLKRLRQKIDVEGTPSIIITVQGLGYRIDS
jgi:DNA-binding response OmpR family regulator